MTLQATRAWSQRWRLALRIGGSGLLAATAAIHLDLYLTGYRSIPTIGGLFLAQVISAFLLAGVVLVTGSRLAAAAAAGFALFTLGGYLIALWVGMFGFREVRTTAGVAAGVVEVAAFFLLSLFAVAPDRPPAPSAPPAVGLRKLVRSGVVPGGGWLTAAAAVGACVVLAVSLAVEGPPSAGSTGAVLGSGMVGATVVLTNAHGFTLYWFSPDTPTSSKCNGACASYWPPVLGVPTAGRGVSGRLGTVRRADGAAQASFDGHPLYTYVGDGGPGQANGNDLDLSGGLWHEVTLQD